MLFSKIIKPTAPLRKYTTMCHENANMFSTTFKIGCIVVLSVWKSTQLILEKIDDNNKKLRELILNIEKK